MRKVKEVGMWFASKEVWREGKLEGMGGKIVRGSDSVEGWLTADDVIKRLEE